jgi:hypothetical protein
MTTGTIFSMNLAIYSRTRATMAFNVQLSDGNWQTITVDNPSFIQGLLSEINVQLPFVGAANAMTITFPVEQPTV